MRDIKFRVYDKSINYLDDRVRVTTTNDYVKVEVLDAFSHWRELEQEQFELMQSTGLKDKNGKEIFEGDILKYNLTSLTKIIKGFVVFARGGYFVMTDGYGENINLFDRPKHLIEVIGNIYENPELLEEC